MDFFEDIKKQVEQGKLFLVAYYGASTTSSEYSFPNWGEIIRYILKDALEVSLGVYKKAYWNLQTVNIGLNGALSEDLLERFDFWVLDKNPNLIFLSAGKNDAYHNIDREITKENTRKMIEKALGKNIKVILTTTVPASRNDLNKKVFDYVRADQEVAGLFIDNKNFIFIDLFNVFPKKLIEKSYTLISEENESIDVKEGEIDPVHYNRYGNAVVAKILLKEVFNIDFNEKKFLKDLLDPTKKYPDY